MRRRVRPEDDHLAMFGGDERLVRFVPSEWPPEPGECLQQWGCHGLTESCPVPPLVRCGEDFYRKHANDRALVERYRIADARWRWTQARRQWLADHGHGTDVILSVFIEDVQTTHREFAGRRSRTQ